MKFIKQLTAISLMAVFSVQAHAQVTLVESDRWLLALGSETMARNVEICDPTLSKIKDIYKKEALRYWSFTPKHIAASDIAELKKVVKMGADKTKSNMQAAGVDISKFCDKLKNDIEATVGDISQVDEKYSPMKGIDVNDAYFTGMVQVVFKSFEPFSMGKSPK